MGNASKLTPAAITSATSVAPKEADDLEPGPTGFAAVDHPGWCSSHEGKGCKKLSPSQRSALVGEFQQRIMEIRQNYGTALLTLEVEQMFEKEDTGDWLASLLLDVAGAYLISKIGSAMKGPSAPTLVGAAMPAAPTSAKLIDGGVKAAIDGAKSAAKARLGSGPPINGSDKQATTAYLVALERDADLAFDGMRQNIPGQSTDEDLIAASNSLDIADHSTELYRQLLRNKLDAFKKSGIANIGRKDTIRGGIGELTPGALPAAVTRDISVVWVEYVAGSPPELRFQRHDGSSVNPLLSPKGSRFPHEGPLAPGPADPLTENSELGDVVPTDLVAVAIERHLKMWGTEPKTIRVSGTNWGGFHKAAQAGYAKGGQ